MGRAFAPRPYQRYAIRRIVDTPAVALLLDMGMGKTVSTLTAIDELMYDRFAVQKVLVIAPLRVALSTWRDECELWEHTRHLRMMTRTSTWSIAMSSSGWSGTIAINGRLTWS